MNNNDALSRSKLLFLCDCFTNCGAIYYTSHFIYFKSVFLIPFFFLKPASPTHFVERPIGLYFTYTKFLKCICHINTTINDIQIERRLFICKINACSCLRTLIHWVIFLSFLFWQWHSFVQLNIHRAVAASDRSCLGVFGAVLLNREVITSTSANFRLFKDTVELQYVNYWPHQNVSNRSYLSSHYN